MLATTGGHMLSVSSVRRILVPILLLAAICLAAHDVRPIRVGVYHNPPKIGLTDGGEPYGFHIELIEEIAEANDWRLEYVPGTWTDLLRQTETGTIDLMLDVALSPSRLMRFSFNDEDVFVNWGVIYVRPGERFRSLEDFENRRIATMDGSIHTTGETGIVNLFSSLGIPAEIDLVEDYDAAFDRVATGRADAAVVNRIFGATFGDDYGLARTPIVFNPVSIRYAFPKNNPSSGDLADGIDRELRRLKAETDGVYFSLIDRYLTGPVGQRYVIPDWLFGVLATSLLAAFVFATLAVSLYRQIMVRRRAESTLAMTQRQLIQSEKLRSHRTLLAGVSHELNNPINFITGSLGGLRAGVRELMSGQLEAADMKKLATEVDGLMDGIAEGTARINAVSYSLRAYTHDDEEDIGETKPADEIRRAVLFADSRRPADVSLTVDIGELPEVLCRPSDIVSIAVELLNNAIEAINTNGTHGGGTIAVIARCLRDRKETCDMVELIVTDNGVGMSEETKAQALDPFFTTHLSESGVLRGLGLSICQETILGIGGSIALVSEPGEGTQVTVRFPSVNRQKRGKRR